jgi:CheY-like chemotaxis protein
MRQVVLIDDDRDDAELFKEVLFEIDNTIGFRHFEESKEALQILSESETNLPDFIFLDINMPVVSGWECLAEFKKNKYLKLIPVVMFTTSSQPKEIEAAKQRGADGFITKPSDYKTLKTLITSVLKQVSNQFFNPI